VWSSSGIAPVNGCWLRAWPIITRPYFLSIFFRKITKSASIPFKNLFLWREPIPSARVRILASPTFFPRSCSLLVTEIVKIHFAQRSSNISVVLVQYNARVRPVWGPFWPIWKQALKSQDLLLVEKRWMLPVVRYQLSCSELKVFQRCTEEYDWSWIFDGYSFLIRITV
jgi:hypothetical protein